MPKGIYNNKRLGERGKWNIGKKRSIEFKDNLSKIWKNTKQSEEHIKKRVNTRKTNNSYLMKEETKDKIRQSLTGKNVGSNNPSWIDGRSYNEYNDNFKRIRRSKVIHKRDNFTCQLCGIKLINTKRGEKNHLTIHHIDYNKQNNNYSNLIMLCTTCNTSVNISREDWTKFFQEKING